MAASRAISFMKLTFFVLTQNNRNLKTKIKKILRILIVVIVIFFQQSKYLLKITSVNPYSSYVSNCKYI